MNGEGQVLTPSFDRTPTNRMLSSLPPPFSLGYSQLDIRKTQGSFLRSMVGSERAKLNGLSALSANRRVRATNKSEFHFTRNATRRLSGGYPFRKCWTALQTVPRVGSGLMSEDQVVKNWYDLGRNGFPKGFQLLALDFYRGDHILKLLGSSGKTPRGNASLQLLADFLLMNSFHGRKLLSCVPGCEVILFRVLALRADNRRVVSSQRTARKMNQPLTLLALFQRSEAAADTAEAFFIIKTKFSACSEGLEGILKREVLRAAPRMNPICELLQETSSDLLRRDPRNVARNCTSFQRKRLK